MQLTILLLGLAFLPEYFSFPQYTRTEAASTTTEQSGTEIPTEEFYEYIIYTTSTLLPNGGSTQESAEPVPDGTTSQMKQVKKRSLLNNQKLLPSSTTEKSEMSCETTLSTETNTSTSEKPSSIVKRQTSDGEATTEAETTGSEEATESAETTEESEAPSTEEEPTDEASPVEASPVEASPVEESPVEASPVEASPVEGSPVEESPVEASPVEESPGVDTSAEPIEEPEEPLAPLQPMVTPLGGEVSPVEADTSVPGGMGSRALSIRSVPASEEEEEENSTLNGSIPTTNSLELSSTENYIGDFADDEENIGEVNQMDHLENDEDTIVNSFARITQVFVIKEIFIGKQKEDILEKFDQYKLTFLNKILYS